MEYIEPPASDIRLRGEHIFRPTEYLAEVNLKRYEKLWGSLQWRYNKWGYVRLTALEKKAVQLEREAIQRHYRTRREIKTYIADNMNVSIREVERKLAKASRVYELLDHYPALGRKLLEFDIIGVDQYQVPVA